MSIARIAGGVTLGAGAIALAACAPTPEQQREYRVSESQLGKAFPGHAATVDAITGYFISTYGVPGEGIHTGAASDGTYNVDLMAVTADGNGDGNGIADYSEVRYIIASYDYDHDGRLSGEEFMDFAHDFAERRG